MLLIAPETTFSFFLNFTTPYSMLDLISLTGDQIRPRHRKCRVLTTGLPGTSVCSFLQADSEYSLI